MKAKAKEIAIDFKYIGGGITTYPYQLTFGISLRYWPCIFAPSIRIHFLIWKLWLYLKTNYKTSKT